MLKVSGTETAVAYNFTVKDEETELTYSYEWGKQPPEGQSTAEYIQSCKREALLLAQDEIDRTKEPTPLNL